VKPAGAVSVTEPPSQNVVGPPGVIVGVAGFTLTVTLVGALVALQPFAFVTVTLYEPLVVTLIDCVVAPVDHEYDAAAGAVSVTEPPAQNVVGPLGVIVEVGNGFTVTEVAALVALQPFAFVTVTLYEPLAVTLIDCVVAPVDHEYEAAADAVSVTEPPAQNVVGPLGVIVAVGNAFTVTEVAALVALQPLAFVIVTLYEPLAVTLMDCVVAPVDHEYDAAAGAVSVTEPPAQNVVGPLGAIVAVGNGFTVTAVAALVALQPFAFVTVTLYEPLVITLMDCVVAPFDHEYDDAAGAVSVTEPPSQNVVGPLGVIVALGSGFAVTCTPLVASQPSALTTVSVTGRVVLTVIDCVCSPVDHEYCA